MNFYAHARLAADEDPDPEHVLGAMIPDLARPHGFAAQELGDEAGAPLRTGIDHHHRIDRAFHARPAFLEAIGRWRDRLGARLALRRGVARAVAHVGLELLLDGHLATAREGVHPAYGEALRAGRRRYRDHRPALGDAFGRLLASPLPQAYSDPAVAAERVAGILARRPRLVLPELARRGLAAELADLRRELRGFAEELVRETVESARERT